MLGDFAALHCKDFRPFLRRMGAVDWAEYDMTAVDKGPIPSGVLQFIKEASKWIADNRTDKRSAEDIASDKTLSEDQKRQF